MIWASVAYITDPGEVHETGAAGIGGLGGIGSHIDPGPYSVVGHVRFMGFDQDTLHGTAAYVQATWIPRPGVSTDSG